MTDSATPPATRTFTADELARCRRLLAEESAVLVSLERGTWKKKVPPADDAPEGTQPTFTDASWIRMVRKWPRISDGDRALCEEFLARFASAKNATVTPPATEPEECGTVEEPKTDRETFSGTWRMRRTALTPLRTDPTQQGVYQTLVWPHDFEGEVGGFCSESSPLHHEDATVYSNASEPPSAEHANDPGHIYRVNGSIDPETGLWSGQKTDDIARTPGLYQTWSRTADHVSVRIRGEHEPAPLFVTREDLDRYSSIDDAVRALFPTTSADGNEETTSSGATSENAMREYLVISSTADMDAYGCFSVSVEITQAIPLLHYETRETAHYSETETVFHNQLSISLPAYSAGSSVVSRLNFSLNEFGLMDGSYSVVTPKAYIAREKQGGAKYEDVQITFGNHASLPSWSEAIQGLSVAGIVSRRLATSFSIQLNEFELLDGTTHWRIPKDSLVKRMHGGARHVDIEVTFENKESIPTWAESTSGLNISGKVAYRLVTGYSLNLNEFGLLDGTTRWRIPKEGLAYSTHAHSRWEDVDVSFENYETIPNFSDIRHSSGGLENYKIVTSSGLRLNEFGLLDGTMTWRIPFQVTKDWHKVSAGADDESLVYQCRGWNLLGGTGLQGANTATATSASEPVSGGSSAYDGSPSQGGGGSSSGGQTPVVGSGHVTVTCAGPSEGMFSIDGSTYASGATVELVAGRNYWVDFEPADGWETPPGTWTGVVSAGATLTLSGAYTAIPGTAANPIVCALLDTENGIYYAGGDALDCTDGAYYSYRGSVFLYSDGLFTEVFAQDVEALDQSSPAKGYYLDMPVSEGTYYDVVSGQTHSLYVAENGSLSAVTVEGTTMHHADGSCLVGSRTQVDTSENIAWSHEPGYRGDAEEIVNENNILYIKLSDGRIMFSGGTYKLVGNSWNIGGDTYYEFDYGQEATPSSFEEGYFRAEFDDNQSKWVFSPVPAPSPVLIMMVDGEATEGGSVQNNEVYFFANMEDPYNAGKYLTGYYRANYNSTTDTWRFTAVSGPRWYKPDGTSFGGYLESGVVYHFSDETWSEIEEGAGYYEAKSLYHTRGERPELNPYENKWYVWNNGVTTFEILDGRVYFFEDDGNGNSGLFVARVNGTELTLSAFSGSMWTFTQKTGPKWYSSASHEEGYLVDGRGYNTSDGLVIAGERQPGLWRLTSVTPVQTPQVDAQNGTYRARYDCNEGRYYETGGTTYLCEAGETEGTTVLTAVSATSCSLLDKDRAGYLTSGGTLCEVGLVYSAGGTSYEWNGESMEEHYVSASSGYAGSPDDPIPISSYEGATIVPFGEEESVAAQEGRYYILMEGAGAGTVYVLSGGSMTEYVASTRATRSLTPSVSQQTISGVDSLPSGPTISGYSENKYAMTKSIRLDFNEFGLVDYVGIAEIEKNPWWGGGSGITYYGGKTRERYVFLANNTKSHTNNTGRIQGTSQETRVRIRGFSSHSSAVEAAEAAVASKSRSQSVSNSLSRHGRWWVLTTEYTTFKSGA